jgi:hypothetical protein
MNSKGLEVVRKEQKEPRTGWSIKSELMAQMELVFRSQAAISRNLHVNAKTLHELWDGKGVRKGTAKGVVVDFIEFLKKLAEGNASAGKDTVSGDLIARLNTKYAPYLENFNFEELLIPPEIGIQKKARATTAA